jgi:putative ABC transport system permease protein
MPDWRELVRRRLAGLAVGPERESEIVYELAAQMEQAYGDALAGGASQAEARTRAEAQFRNWDELAREIGRAEHGRRPRWFAGAWHDARFAGRYLSRHPGFAAIAVLTLGFGIGASVAVFSLMDALVLRSLPYPDASRLMAVDTRRVQQPEIEPWTSPPDFFDLRERTRTFSAMAAIDPVWNMVLTGRGDAQQLTALFASADLFPLLGVKAKLGRTFSPREDDRHRPMAVTMLSHGFWQRRFGGRRDAVGQVLHMDGNAYTVIGVLPADFHYEGEPLAGTAADIDVYLPLAANPLTNGGRGLRCLKVIARLRPGVSVEQAAGDVRRIGEELAGEYGASNRGFAMDVQPLRAQVTGRFEVTMLLLFGAVGFVLLMACANVAGLLLARSASRAREISVRVAMGAPRVRLLRQLLTEGLVLAAAGGIAGLAMAHFSLKLLVAAAPASLIAGRTIQLDARALLFAAVAVLASAMVSGLPPAWRMVRGDIAHALREAGRGLTAGHHGLRAALVVAQVAVALVLLVGASLLIRSFQRLMEIDPGFQARQLLTIATQAPQGAQKPDQRLEFYRRVSEAVAAVPGVRSVAAASRLPMMGTNLGSALFIEGKSTPGEQGPDVEYRVVTDNYFATMGIPLRAGRLFDRQDDAQADGVLLINQTMARRFWPGESAVGKRVKLGPSPEKQAWITIIGVVGDIRHFGLDAEPRPEIYRPNAYSPMSAPMLAIRTEGDPAALAETLAARVRSVSPEVPAYHVATMEELVNRSTTERRFVMWMLTLFSLAALLLAGVGIYGAMSQAVAQRTPEIGLRMALGASPSATLRMVLRQGFGLALEGIALGAVGAAICARLLGGMLFEIRPLDLPAFAGATFVLALFALLACYWPARRATRVDPLETLRRER